MKLLGIDHCMSEDFAFDIRKKVGYPFCAISVYKDTKKKVLKIEIQDSFDSIQKAFAPSKPTKRSKKKTDFNKKIDKSKWVKPDEESIRDELLLQLGLCLVFEYKSEDYRDSMTRAEVLHSLLHTTAPKNPQSLNSYGLSDPITHVLWELKNKKELKNEEILFDLKIKPFEKRRKKYMKWRNDTRLKMITVLKPTKRAIQERKKDEAESKKFQQEQIKKHGVTKYLRMLGKFKKPKKKKVVKK